MGDSDILSYQPGQTVTFYKEVKNVNGQRTDDGYIPVVTRVVYPGFVAATGYPQSMSRLDVGLYFFQLVIPQGATAVGTYLVDIVYLDPNSLLLVSDSRQIVVTAPYGNYSTSTIGSGGPSGLPGPPGPAGPPGPYGIAGGDLLGTYPNPKVIAIQGHAISPITPTDGYALTWSAIDGYWKPKSVFPITVPNIAALTTISATDGHGAFVQSVLAPWYFVTNGSALTVDHITVEATALGGNTRWVREYASIPLYINQTQWHVNALSGNDENNGLTAGTALKTYEEIVRRLGKDVEINVVVDVYIHGNILATDTVRIFGTLGQNALWNIHGVPVVAHSSTLTGVVPYNQVTNQWDEIQETGFDFTPYVGNTLVVINTGSPNGPSYCYIAKAIALGRARVSFLGQRDPTNPYNEQIGPASAGNTYQLWTLPFIANYREDQYMGYNELPVTNQVNVEFLHLPVFTVRQSLNVQHNECIYDGFFQNGLSGVTLNPCLNCSFNMSILGFCSTNFGLLLNSQVGIGTGLWLMFGLIMQNSQIKVDTATGDGSSANVEIHHSSWGLGIFDSTNPLVFDMASSLMIEGGVWGQGNTGTTLQLLRGGHCTIVPGASTGLHAATPVGGNDFTIDSYTALPAVDPTTFSATAPRNLTFANYNATVASGGFQNAVFNPRFPMTGMTG